MMKMIMMKRRRRNGDPRQLLYCNIEIDLFPVVHE